MTILDMKQDIIVYLLELQQKAVPLFFFVAAQTTSPKLVVCLNYLSTLVASLLHAKKTGILFIGLKLRRFPKRRISNIIWESIYYHLREYHLSFGRVSIIIWRISLGRISLIIWRISIGRQGNNKFEDCNDMTVFGTQLFISKVHGQTRNDTKPYITIIHHL